MAVKEKKRVQVQIDKELADNTEAVLSQLGLNPTTAINMFYKGIVADAALPFKPALSEAERANLSLLKATKETDLKDLLDKSLHEPDPEKRKVYDALYTYFLDKRQKGLCPLIDKPQYIIVAGINGAGKSTLYDTFPSCLTKQNRLTLMNF